MKEKEEFDKINVFGLGEPNDVFCKVFYRTKLPKSINGS